MHCFRTSSISLWLIVLLALWPAAAPAASQGSVAGPKMGYFFDAPQRSLRPILGVPGAARIGDAAPLNVQLTKAEVAPGQQYALGATAEGGLVWIDLRGDLPQTRPIAVGVTAISRILLSPTGEAGAIYDRGSRQVQFLSRLLDSPSAGATVGIESLQGVLTALAVSDDARTLLAATASADADGSLYVLQAGGEVRRVSAAGRVLSMAFLPQQDNALIADYGRSEVLRIDGVRSVAVATLLAAGRDGVAKPLAVQVDAKLNHAVAALDGTGRLALIPLAGGAARFVECNCRPRELTQMRGDSLFRLTSDPSQPLFVLDAGRLAADGETMDPRVVFIPADAGRAAPPKSNLPLRPRAAR